MRQPFASREPSWSFGVALVVALVTGCATTARVEPAIRIVGPGAGTLPPRAVRSRGEADATVGRLPAASALCPEEMALVGERLCVDRWEASIVASDAAGVERAWSPYDSLDHLEGKFRAVSRPDVVPQAYISGRQADAACRASGKRLCAAAEWELACQGAERRTFPYGREREDGTCNDDVRAEHPVIEAARREGLAAGRAWHEGMNLGAMNQLPDTLATTGSHPGCKTPDGVFDLVGNLHEWIDDADGTFRGGYYMDTTRNGDGCTYDTTAHDFDYHDYSTGFRCCMDVADIE